MALIWGIPSIGVASGVAWLITRRTGPLTWWLFAGGLQVVLQIMWSGVLSIDADLTYEAAAPLGSVLAVLTIALISGCLRFARRGRRLYAPPPHAGIKRDRKAVGRLLGSVAGGTALAIWIASRPAIVSEREVDVPGDPQLLDRARPARPAGTVAGAIDPRIAWAAAPDHAADLERFRDAFAMGLERLLSGVAVGSASEERLWFADHVHVELTASINGIPLAGNGDVYMTNKGVLFVVSLADPASRADRASAFSRAMARIEKRLPRHVDEPPADYMKLDRSWYRQTDPALGPGSVIYDLTVHRRSHVDAGLVIAWYRGSSYFER
jgi:hypothetical protein